MKWNHLPVEGGIYRQHPQLMDRIYYILAERSKHEEAERSKQTKESGPKGSSRPAHRRPRR